MCEEIVREPFAVIPANAGRAKRALIPRRRDIQSFQCVTALQRVWTPAFAGVTAKRQVIQIFYPQHFRATNVYA
jgi:hypothetical protein